MKPKRLGRGLIGLLSRSEEPQASPPPTPPEAASPPAAGGRLGHVPMPQPIPESASSPAPRMLLVAGIKPNPFQPRTGFDEAALGELTDSIRTHGVLQPIVVRRALGGYEVLAGERRLRASRAAGLTEIPAVVREATDEEMQTLALVENLQREDLNALEKARALKSMMGNFGLTQDQVAARVGKARTTVANILRLLDLPAEIQRWVEEGRLSGAHARALLLVKGPERRITLGRLAVELGLSVREIERRAASSSDPSTSPRSAKSEDPFVADVAARIRRTLSAPVRVVRRGKGGRIEVRYSDAADLDRLLALLNVM